MNIDARSHEQLRADLSHAPPSPHHSTTISQADETWNRRESSVSQKSLVLEQGFDRYLEMSEQGEVDLTRLLAEFPDYQHSLMNMIRVREHVDELLAASIDPATPPLAWPEAGDGFLDFDLVCELGRGALSRVFLATQRTLGDRVVVVKLAPWGEDEANTLGPLKHHNIVEVHSHHRDSLTGITALCMPLEGVATLADVLDYAASAQAQGGLTSDTIVEASQLASQSAPTHAELADQTLQQPDAELLGKSYVAGVMHVGVQLADALAYTHRRGIVHNDIKPSNVLLTPGGKPLLMDFNLSSDRIAQRRRVGGTLPYMAPERIRELFLGAAPHDSAVAGDVYSLGAVLYELLGGDLPYGSPNPSAPPLEAAQEMSRRQQRRPRASGPRWRDAPANVRSLLQSCVAADPAERPASAESLAIQLRRALRPAPKRPWMQPATLACVLALAAVAAAAVGPHGRWPRHASQPQSVHAALGFDAVQRRDFAGAARNFQVAHERADQSPLFLAWRFYCGLAAAHNSDELLSVHQALVDLGYQGRELQANYAALLSVCEGMDPHWVAVELDRAVANFPDAIGPRMARARYCSMKRTTIDANDYGYSDILAAVNLAGSRADASLHFLAAKIVAQSMRLRSSDVDEPQTKIALEQVRKHFLESARLGLHRDGAQVIAFAWPEVEQQSWFQEVVETMNTNGKLKVRDRAWMLVAPADPG